MSEHPELPQELDIINTICKVFEPANKLELLKFELKHKIDFESPHDELSEEYLNSLPDQIKELEKEILDIYKISPMLMEQVENHKNNYKDKKENNDDINKLLSYMVKYKEIEVELKLLEMSKSYINDFNSCVNSIKNKFDKMKKEKIKKVRSGELPGYYLKY